MEHEVVRLFDTRVDLYYGITIYLALFDLCYAINPNEGIEHVLNINQLFKKNVFNNWSTTHSLDGLSIAEGMATKVKLMLISRPNLSRERLSRGLFVNTSLPGEGEEKICMKNVKNKYKNTSRYMPTVCKKSGDYKISKVYDRVNENSVYLGYSEFSVDTFHVEFDL